MKVAGVIAEFDPFHNGHAYFLRRVRELTSADFIIAVMSGDFTQRGNIAVAGKKLRAEAALKNGADLIIELPLQYATASAELFAMGGVSLLDSTGVVDTVCFGTEEEDIETLKAAADILAGETDSFRQALAAHLKEGMNYPAARMKVVKELMFTDPGPEDAGREAVDKRHGHAGYVSEEKLNEALTKPNNILAVEYLKALKRLGSEMKPVNIKRGAVDHDSANTYGIYSSAKNIRRILKTTRSMDAVSGYLPENTVSLMKGHFGTDFPLFDDDMSSLLRYRLLMENEDSMIRYADMSPELAHRIINKRDEFISLTQFTELLKTRNLTYTRISRALLHVFLSVTKEDMRLYLKGSARPCANEGQVIDAAAGNNSIAGYIRVLGFKRKAASLMEGMKGASSVPVISKAADYKKFLKSTDKRMFEDTLRASGIYCSIIKDIYGTDVPSDISSMAIGNDDYIIF